MSDFIEFGIDISHWNRVQDLKKTKDSGMSFCIIKAGGSDKGFYTDSRFYEYYDKAVAVGLKVGAYYFVGRRFSGYDSGSADAERFYNIIKGLEFDYPLCLDVEITGPKERDRVTEACIGFCEYLQNKDKYVSIYASDISGFKERLNLDYLVRYDKWVARYGTAPRYVKNYGIWQRSSTGTVPGIIGNVDLDVSYKDYKTIMVNRNLNRR